jgi:hypothetical protein
MSKIHEQKDYLFRRQNVAGIDSTRSSLKRLFRLIAAEVARDLAQTSIPQCFKSKDSTRK